MAPLLALASSVACSTAPGEGAGGPGQLPLVEAPPLPEPQPLRARPLGAAPWLAIAATPARDALVVGMPRALTRLTWPTLEVKWSTPLDAAPMFVAVSGEGALAAALVSHESTAELELVEVDAATGAIRARRRVEMPAAPSHGPQHSMQLPTTPTALFAAPEGPGWWIVNAYGTFALRTQDSGGDLQKTSIGARAAVAQGGGAVWWPWTSEAGVGQIRSAERTLSLDCYPQKLAVDARVDRVLTVCADAPAISVRAYALSSGVRLGEWRVSDYPELAILGPDEMVLLEASPSRWGHIKGGSLTWTPQGRAWSRFEVSPSGRTAIGVGSGVLQAVDLASGAVRCTFGDARPWGAGLEDDDLAWVLGFADGAFNQLQLQRLDLKTCGADPPRALDLGKTTNLGAVWLHAARAFALNALYGEGYGPVMVGVDGRVVPLRGRSTPMLMPSDDGRALALVESEQAEVFASGPPPRSLGDVREAARVAVCGERTLAYMWNLGWRVYEGGALTRPVPLPRFAPQPQVDEVACAGDTLLVGRSEHWYVMDHRTGTVLATFPHGGRVGPVSVLPGGRAAIVGGGPTGWQVIELRGP